MSSKNGILPLRLSLSLSFPLSLSLSLSHSLYLLTMTPFVIFPSPRKGDCYSFSYMMNRPCNSIPDGQSASGGGMKKTWASTRKLPNMLATNAWPRPAMTQETLSCQRIMGWTFIASTNNPAAEPVAPEEVHAFHTCNISGFRPHQTTIAHQQIMPEAAALTDDSSATAKQPLEFKIYCLSW
eukprot:s3797_g2.t1